MTNSIRDHGTWENISLPQVGQVTLTIVSRGADCDLTVQGGTVAPRYLGANRESLVLPPQLVPQSGRVVVRAISRGGQPFPADHVVDLAVAVGTASVLLRGIPVAGQVEAGIATIERGDGNYVLRPGEGGIATLGLGGWCAKRREEDNRPIVPTISRIVVDTSSSMRFHDDEVAALLKWVEDLYDTVGTAHPEVRSGHVDGRTERGVGYVVGPSGSGRTVTLTDLPLLDSDGESLVLGTPQLLRALPSVLAFCPSEELWAELKREDKAFTDQTLRTLDPLLEWVSRPATTIGALS